MAPAEKPSADDGNQLALEVTVLSAESLKNRSSRLLPGRRLRPYVTLSLPSSSSSSHHSEPPPLLFRTRIDECGARNPSWRDTIRFPLGPSFLLREHGRPDADAAAAAVHVSVLSKRCLRGPARLGWCRIPASDVLDGLRPPSALRRLSYALRHPRHGGRGHGVIHVAVRLLGPHVEMLPPHRPPPEPGWCRVVIGIPAARGGHEAHWRGVWNLRGKN